MLLCLVLVTVINLSSSISAASSLTVTITSLSQVDVNSSFDVGVEAEVSDDIYDIKLSVQDDAGKIISKTLNNGTWKSSTYFIIGVYPSQKTFSLMALFPQDEASVCVKFRKTLSKTATEQFCQPIKINSASTPVKDNSNFKSTSLESPSASSSAPSSEISSDDIISPSTKPQNLSEGNINSNNDVIYLNLPVHETATTLTSAGMTRLYLAYAFAALVIILLVLIVLDKI